MAYKTSAEQQMEFLKKLKEQQKTSKPRPKPATGAVDGQRRSESLAVVRAKTSKSKVERSLPVSEQAWQNFVRGGLQNARYKRNKATGDWAIELLLHLPAALADLPKESKDELYAKITEWASNRGLKNP